MEKERELLQELEQIVHKLNLSTDFDVKYVTMEYVLGFTDPAICKLISSNKIINNFLKLLSDPPKIAALGCKLLINFSADEEGANKLYSHDEKLLKTELKQDYKGLIPQIYNFILDPESIVADAACMLLSNLTRSKLLAGLCWKNLEEKTSIIDEFISVFCTINYNKTGCKLDYLGPIFSNLSQLKEIRCHLLDNHGYMIQKLFPFTDHNSIIRKGGTIGVIRNCSFDIECHQLLLSSEVDVLPRLLLPLAGPEEFSDEDVNKLPIDLQYLPDSKTREPDPDIRIMLLETLNQLCSTKNTREYLRDHNTYLILRELHKWETDRKALLACENVVDILIRTEEEIDVDNIQSLDVTPDMEQKFEKMDADFITDS